MIYTNYNSAAFPGVAQGVEASKSNPVLLSALSELYVFDGVPVYSPDSIVEDYMDAIMEEVTTVSLPEELWFRPEALSESLYGTPDLWYLLMRINGMTSVTDFKMDVVKIVPPSSSIMDLILAKHIKEMNAQHQNPMVLQDLTIREIL